MTNNQLRYVILAGLFAVPFVPLIVSSSLFFPFITGKAFVFRLIVEIVFACYLVLAIRDESYRPKFSWIWGAILAFILIMGIADLFGENPFKAFWSNYERMEGYALLLHLGAFFVVMSGMVRSETLWNRVFATSVGASAIMAVYSFFQLAGKIAINQGGVRVDGTLGNASYLGIYMVFNIFFAALLFARSGRNWQKVLLAVVAILDLAVLYFTATRGAVLGLIGGIFIAFIFLLIKSDKGDKIRKIATMGIVSLIVFIGLFVALRNVSFVEQSRVLSRFSSLSFSEVKTQGRYYVWPMAVKGFIEKPVLGWGQEGFNFVFNKYYDPRMYNQEPWFDRAHSTLLDWLIAGGALGLLSYLAIIFFLVYYIAKSDGLQKRDKAILFGLLSAYFFSNLFVFDQIASYILFFTVLSYVQSLSPEARWKAWDKVSGKMRAVFPPGSSKPVFEAVIIIVALFVIYFVVVSPWRQNKSLLAVLRLGNEGKTGTIEEYMKPFSGHGMGYAESLEHISQAAINVSMSPATPVELKQRLFEEVDKAFINYIEDVPGDARYRLFYSLFLSRFGWYGKAAEQAQEAIKLSPKKQQMYFELASSRLLEGKTAEAALAAKTAYELEPSNEEAKIVYGLTLLASGDGALSGQILEGVSRKRIIFDDRVITVLLALKDYGQIIEIIKTRIELDPANLQHRITLTAAYLQADRRQEAISTLEEIIKLEPSFKERGEYYIKEIKAGRNP